MLVIITRYKAYLHIQILTCVERGPPDLLIVLSKLTIRRLFNEHLY